MEPEPDSGSCRFHFSSRFSFHNPHVVEAVEEFGKEKWAGQMGKKAKDKLEAVLKRNPAWEDIRAIAARLRVIRSYQKLPAHRSYQLHSTCREGPHLKALDSKQKMDSEELKSDSLDDVSFSDDSYGVPLEELITAAEEGGMLSNTRDNRKLAKVIVEEIHNTLENITNSDLNTLEENDEIVFCSNANGEILPVPFEYETLIGPSGKDIDENLLISDAFEAGEASTSSLKRKVHSNHGTGRQVIDCDFDVGCENDDPQDDPDYELSNDDNDESSGEEEVVFSNDLPVEESRTSYEDKDSRMGEEDNFFMVEKVKRVNSKQETKAKREKGEKYVGYRRKDKKINNKVIHDTPRSERKMGPLCFSAKCKQMKTRSCDQISEEDRLPIFQRFWKEMTWETKKMYVCGLVTLQEKRSSSHSSPGKVSRRKNSFFYHLRVGNITMPVCKSMFLNTLGLREKTVRKWVMKFHAEPNTTFSPDETQGINETDDPLQECLEDQEERVKAPPSRGRSRDALKQRNAHLKSFLEMIPKLPSHYARKDTNKLYLQVDFACFADLHNVYKKKCADDGLEPLCRTAFDKVCKRFNIAIFQPRKDQCDLCSKVQVNSNPTELYLRHRTLKDRAQREKDMDKTIGLKGDIHIISVDLMAVQVLPRLLASAAYYKLKLQVHNYSIYNLATRDVKCYWWDETGASLDASTYASCLIDYLEELLELAKKTVIIWSDGCTPQNRNKVLSNALLHLSIKHGVTIMHKYLEKGHTQMEVDSVHAHVEEQIKKSPVYLPCQYLDRTAAGRKNPPYRAVYLDHEFFLDYSFIKGMVYSSIRPGNQRDDPVVTDLRWLQYEPDGMIKYKTAFDGDLTFLPRRPNLKNAKFTNFPKLFKSRRPIPLDKFNDLQSLKDCGIPKDCHAFYDLLPKLGKSIREENRKRKRDYDEQ
ncbi:hypothetical protein GE061_017949 [Apolygus lucorum]|uniref:Uncharacterized protein n=1 Tax=Apolygus lucorum TaxID=248454 RepID=A0A8S9XCK7_APOLU|nr:hypothetical protein GE061_017949 [Apolygus lucorum]